MQKYHVNPETGNPGVCKARPGYCRFGDSDAHYHSPEEARQAYENGQESFSSTKVSGGRRLTFEVHPLSGHALLSQGASGNPLRARSDIFNSTFDSLHQAESIGISAFGGKCACGTVLFKLKGGYWEQINDQNTDHILPASAGHLAAAGNLQPLCPDCNSRVKSNRHYSEMYAQLVAEGTITESRAKALMAKTENLLERVYFKDFPELRELNTSGERYDLEYDGKITRIYTDLYHKGKITPKASGENERRYGDTEAWQALNDTEAIATSLGSSPSTANDVRRRKHQLQAAWEEVIGEKSIKDVTTEEWSDLSIHYLASKLHHAKAHEFDKAKRTLRAFALLSDREELEEHTRNLPGFAHFSAYIEGERVGPVGEG